MDLLAFVTMYTFLVSCEKLKVANGLKQYLSDEILIAVARKCTNLLTIKGKDEKYLLNTSDYIPQKILIDIGQSWPRGCQIAVKNFFLIKMQNAHQKRITKLNSFKKDLFEKNLID